MGKLEDKCAILAAAKERMHQIVMDFETEVTELKSATINEKHMESASQTETTKNGDFEVLDSLIQQHEFAKKELEVLDTIECSKAHKVIEFGSIVITDKLNLFVSTGVEAFDVNGTAFFGLSTQAPLYPILAGRKANEQVDFNGINYQIKAVY